MKLASFAAALFILVGCNGSKVPGGIVDTVHSDASSPAKPPSLPAPEGASSSSGDAPVAFSSFQFNCKVVYSDQLTGVSNPTSFSIDEKNFRGPFATADYDIQFNPRWQDYPAPEDVLDIHLVLKAPGGGLEENVSRSMARFPLAQERIEFWIYNHQKEPEAKPHRRSLQLKCDRVESNANS